MTSIFDLDKYRKILPRRVFIEEINNGAKTKELFQSIDHSILSIDMIKFHSELCPSFDTLEIVSQCTKKVSLECKDIHIWKET